MSFNQFTESAILCPNCGAQNGSSATTCRNCGAVLVAQPQYPQYQNQYQQPQYQDPYQQPQYQDPYQQPQYQNPYQEPQYDQYADAQQHKVHGVLAYFGILVLVPLLGAKGSQFARFHANQGLALWLISLVLTPFASIPVISFVAGAAGLVIFVLSIMGIVNAAKGEMKELPLVGKLKMLK